MKLAHHIARNTLAYAALFVALTGTSYAAVTLSGAQVKDGSLTGADVRDGSLTQGDLQANARAAAGRRGPRGPRGLRGSRGLNGPHGPMGAAGVAGPPGLTGREVISFESPSIVSTGGQTATVGCPAGKIAISGGAEIVSSVPGYAPKVFLTANNVTDAGTGWTAEAYVELSGETTAWKIVAHAVCASNQT